MVRSHALQKQLVCLGYVLALCACAGPDRPYPGKPNVNDAGTSEPDANGGASSKAPSTGAGGKDGSGGEDGNAGNAGSAGESGASGGAANNPSTDPGPNAAPVTRPDERGQYQIGKYDASLGTLGSIKATVRFPSNAKPGETFPGIAASAGNGGTKDDIDWIAEHLTSHGYVTISLTPGNIIALTTTEWANAINVGLEAIKKDNTSDSSPLKGLLDPARLGALGHSMGGGGALEAASGNPELKAVVGLAPHIPFMPKDVSVKVPVQLQAGEKDQTSDPKVIQDYYYSDKLPNGVLKELLVIKNVVHDDYRDLDALIGRGKDWVHPITSRYFTAWFNYHLKGLVAYASYIYGADAQKDVSANLFTKFDYVDPQKP